MLGQIRRGVQFLGENLVDWEVAKKVSEVGLSSTKKKIK